MRKSLDDHMAQIAVWKSSQLEENRLAKGLAKEELAMLQAQLTDLANRIEELKDRQSTLETVPDDIERRAHGEQHRAVLTTLQGDHELLAHRAAELGAARSAELASLEEALTRDEELNQMVQDFERFCEVETQLGNLPESYRKAILTHHDTVRRRLEPSIRSAEGTDASLDTPQESLSIVVSADPEDGDPTALVMLIPTSIEVHTRWRERGEDLSSELTYRLYAAACRISAQLGVPDAPITCRPFEGHLAVQIWFGNGSVTGNVREVVELELQKLREQATELRAAQLVLTATWIAPEALTPPDEAPDGDLPVNLSRVQVGVGQQVDWSSESEPAPPKPAEEEKVSDEPSGSDQPVLPTEEASS